MPDTYDGEGGCADKRFDVMKQRYVEEKKEKTENELLEEKQLKAAQIRTQKEKEKEAYDMILEDQILFKVMFLHLLQKTFLCWRSKLFC